MEILHNMQFLLFVHYQSLEGLMLTKAVFIWPNIQ